MTKTQHKKNKIMQAAMRLFVSKGFHNSSMQLLAKKAGVATGSIYTYFPGKKELISEVFNSLLADVEEYVQQGYDQTATVEARFRHLVSRRIDYNIKNAMKFKLMSMYARNQNILDLVNAEDYKLSPMYWVMEDGFTQGLFRQYERCDVFFFIFGGLNAMLEYRLKNNLSLTEQDIHNMIDMCWNAIKI